MSLAYRHLKSSLSHPANHSFTAIRYFSSSSCLQQRHYDTLGVRRAATRQEIKANYYKLSKKWHPDVNPNDEGAKTKFQAVSEAYAILGDDRQRRAYDRSLGTHSLSNEPYHSSSAFDPDNLSRRPRATHAWEHRRRRPAQHTPHSAGAASHSHTHAHAPHGRESGYSQAYSFNAQRAARPKTYRQRMEEEAEHVESRVRRDNGVWRFVQVFGVLWVVVSIGGSWGK